LKENLAAWEVKARLYDGVMSGMLTVGSKAEKLDKEGGSYGERRERL